MTQAFLKIVNMSISAGWLVLAVLVLRLVLKKAPKWVCVLLWGIVAIRLICPISIESALSLIPSAEIISPEIMMDPTPAVTTGIPALNSALNPVISDSFAPNPGDSANPLQIWIPTASVIWAVGVAGMLAYALISYLRLKKRVSTAFSIGKNIRQSEYVDSPFVLGLFRPVIYLPIRLDSADMEPVIAHELTHIRRKDHWWKPLGYTLLAVHWFNPLMWVAYILLCRDIELACDEQVIAGMDSQSRADYTQALVACAVNRRTIAACPLAFGEVGVKERVRSVMNYRKPGFWGIVFALIVCMVMAVCFLTNPPEETIYEIYRQDGYTVIDQRKIDVTLYVEKAKLPDAIYTPEGYDFAENEVVVYSTHTTRIYLDKVMLSNESDDLLYFSFDFSYDLPKAGNIVTQFEHIDEHDGMKTRLYLRSKDMRDTNTTYPDALAIRGYGPGTQFDLYVSKEACMEADGTLKINIVCNELVYTKDGHGYESQDYSSSNSGAYSQDDILNLGLNARITEIDADNHILYVEDLNKHAEVFGSRCAIDCTYAISRYNLLYVSYGFPDDVRTIDFSVFEVGDAVIVGLTDDEKQKAYNGSAVAEMIQLATQRLE